MKDYVVNNFKAINYQYAVGQLSTYIDLEGCSLETMMFEKYPSISPYTYCANNPMKYVDPTGEEGEDSESWIKRKDGTYVFDSRVITQKDAEKYYGKDAEAIADGYYIQTTKGEVIFLDNGVYMLNDKKYQVKDQAKGIAKVVAEIRNFDASLEGHNDGDNSGDPWLQKNVAPVLEGLALLNPLIGIANGVYTAAAGEDIYGNEASTANRIISGVGVIAGGVSNVAKGTVSTVSKGIDKAIDAWTVYQTIKAGYKKQNNNENKKK
ncbi:MAG: hypothetical protein KBA86_00210 [Bacteroidales bacterium]|nr:hypothetical protein [Bacteroidales bacterium]